jgi:hypothetical protein
MDPYADPRFAQGVELFNSAQWYEAHDVFEDLWHDTAEPERRWVQGVVQIAVAMVHLTGKPQWSRDPFRRRPRTTHQLDGTSTELASSAVASPLPATTVAAPGPEQ